MILKKNVSTECGLFNIKANRLEWSHMAEPSAFPHVEPTLVRITGAMFVSPFRTVSPLRPGGADVQMGSKSTSASFIYLIYLFLPAPINIPEGTHKFTLGVCHPSIPCLHLARPSDNSISDSFFFFFLTAPLQFFLRHFFFLLLS